VNLILGTTFVASLVALVASRLSRSNAEVGNAAWRTTVLAFLLLPAVAALTDLLSPVWNTELGLFPQGAVQEALVGAGIDRPQPALFERPSTGDGAEAQAEQQAIAGALDSPTAPTVGERLRGSRRGARNAWRWVMGEPQPEPRLVWLIGALVGLSWMIRDCWWIRWLVSRGARLCPEAMASAVSETAADAGLRAPPRCVLSARLPVPVVVGVFRPRLALPDTFNVQALGARAVLAHEMGHVARRDPWWALLARLAKVVWWWHPLAHIAARECRRTSELACDDRSLRTVDDRVGLATQIADGTERALGLAVSAHSDDARHLRRRVARLLSGAVAPGELSRRAGRAVGIAAFVTLAFLGCVRIAKDEARSELPAYPVTGTYHLLFVGTDSRGLADTAIVGFLGFDTRRAALLAVDRSLLVPGSGDAPEDDDAKVAGLLASSPDRPDWRANRTKRRASLGRLLGVEFDVDVSMGVGHLWSVADALGAIEVDVPSPMRYDDRGQDLHIDIGPGLQQLTAANVAGYLQYRLANRMGGAAEVPSAARTERHLGFLRKVHGVLVRNRERGDMRLPHSVGQALSSTTTSSLTPTDWLALVRFACEVEPADLRTEVLSGTGKMVPNVGYCVVADPDEVRAKVGQMEAWVKGR